MTVMVKGMKMPNDCIDCPCFNDEYSRCNITMTSVGPFFYDIPKDCPLVEVEEDES